MKHLKELYVALSMLHRRYMEDWEGNNEAYDLWLKAFRILGAAMEANRQFTGDFDDNDMELEALSRVTPRGGLETKE